MFYRRNNICKCRKMENPVISLKQTSIFTKSEMSASKILRVLNFERCSRLSIRPVDKLSITSYFMPFMEKHLSEMTANKSAPSGNNGFHRSILFPDLILLTFNSYCKDLIRYFNRSYHPCIKFLPAKYG